MSLNTAPIKEPFSIRMAVRHSMLALLAAFVSACSDQNEPTPQELRDALADAMTGGEIFEPRTEIVSFKPRPNPDRNAYYGDLHVHTAYSFDAFMTGTIATPYDAYRFARGETIKHPAGIDIKLREPMDFYAVTDHAMFLGVAAEAANTDTVFSKKPFAEPLHNLNAPGNLGTGLDDIFDRFMAASLLVPRTIESIQNGSVTRDETLDIARSAWADIIRTADQFNEPGRFTTFVGYEYTSMEETMGNLHRNVIFRNSDRLPDVPFSRFHSQNPEGLWDWMDALRDEGIEALAIPHNSNASNGQMFKLEDWAGNPLDDAYSEQRLRNEPLVEITQIKGTSETHPLLSTRDEWAGFEIMPFKIATSSESKVSGGYVREALLNGLSLENQNVTNPFEFGFIGSSDTHTAASQNDEANYLSEHGVTSATPVSRGSVPVGWLAESMLKARAPEVLTENNGRSYLNTSGLPYFSASGLAAVWAEENTRESIYAAFRRKETFATSGPRLKLRFFAGYGYDDDLIHQSDGIARAYAAGVSMGGRIEQAGNDIPGFFVWALADAHSAPLQRLQIIKGWIDAGGNTHEEVIDIACAGGAEPAPDTNRCPDNGANVDLSDCSINAETGAAELKTLWRDPNFDSKERVFYYARVLENPTCRWSTWDALRAGIAPRSDLPATIQERAWSSPIHYRPAS